jgi:hypothetical protein
VANSPPATAGHHPEPPQGTMPCAGVSVERRVPSFRRALGPFGVWPMSTDRRQRRDLHALDEDGMVLCNPRDKEAAHRAAMEGIATDDRAAVTCRKCLTLLYRLDKARGEGSDIS